MSKLTVNTIENAPEASRPFLERGLQRFGFVPNILGALSESPVAIESYMTLMGILGKSALSAAEQQLVMLAISKSNNCEYCVPAHSLIAENAGLDVDVIEAVWNETSIEDNRLAVLRDTAVAITEQRGVLAEVQTDRFFDAGFTKADLLDVIVGAAVKTISNYANHLGDIELDEAFQTVSKKYKDAA